MLARVNTSLLISGKEQIFNVRKYFVVTLITVMMMMMMMIIIIVKLKVMESSLT